MDIELARTFLAVIETGSFIEAALRVHVTQSTVSMRIKSLEEQLGKSLFIRSKAGATLTQAGAQFQRHAQALVRVWQQARLDIALPPGYQASLTIGGQYSLWDGYLLHWLPWMRQHAPEVALRAQLSPSTALMEQLTEGALDLVVMYTPQRRPGFEIEHLFEEELVLVSSEPKASLRLDNRYILVNWGPEFQADHALNYPDLTSPGLYFDLGSLGVSYLLENSASGYFPRRAAMPYLESGELTIVNNAPAFKYATYAVYPSDGDPALFLLALKGLREIAANTLGITPN
ncbi:MAG: LysR family transcriptional regulator [Alphaproteobacteria bacterium]|nr:LysR family transcriptional regulator [Alphaproteobacteria bacterium]